MSRQKIGKIVYDSDDILGLGHSGKVVYRGSYEAIPGMPKKSIPVAVKRILKGSTDVIFREIEILTNSNVPASLVRYFATEDDHNFYYIATELCDFSLADYIEGTPSRMRGKPCIPLKKTLDPPLRLSTKEILQSCLTGVQYLHDNHFVHREIKPHNYLISRARDSDIIKLSDFGITKKVTEGEFSMSGPRGTEGWAPLEMMEPKGKATFAVDIFSLGCVFAYVLSDGNHPFGNNKMTRPSNIYTGTYDLSDIQESLARSMIDGMIKRYPQDRIRLSSVVNHPYFKRHPDFYELRGALPGLCVIINQKNFVTLRERIGTDEDRDSLMETFGLFGMDVEVYENLKASEIHQRLRTIASRDLSAYQCLVVCLLSHGDEGTIYGVNGTQVKISELTDYFKKGQMCPSLLSKPKLFFISACQGEIPQVSPAVRQSPAPSIRSLGISSDGAGSAETSKFEFEAMEVDEDLPDVTDFLEVYSTVEGYASFRDFRQGTVFIDTLCEVLKSEGHRDDLMTVLHKVNQRVAEWTAGNGLKQMPQIRSSLRKKLQLLRLSEEFFIKSIVDMVERKCFNEVFQQVDEANDSKMTE